MSWAKESNALYATCRENPDVLKESNLFASLADIDNEETRKSVLTVCVDYIWGRGILEIDLGWLKYVCDTLDLAPAPGETRILSAPHIVQDILRDESSDFWSIWAGEVYPNQIEKVLERLEQQ